MKRRLLYFDAGRSSFVRKDLSILSTRFEVVDYSLDLRQKWRLPVAFIRQFFIALFSGKKTAAVVVQFAGFQSYVPFLVFGWLGKKRVIVAGGTDCVAFPSIAYGNFQRPFLSWFTRRSFEMADLILPVHETLIRYDYTYQPNDGTQQGYRVFVKNIRAKEQVIWNGYDVNIWKPRDVKRNARSFLTVGAGLNSRFGYQLKGIDLFVAMARAFPDCTFTIVGGEGFAPADLPANVQVLGAVPNEKLPELYSRHEYYVQLSMSEGFPNALTEAILCGCRPLVSNVGAMPMIVQNDRSCILMKKDAGALVELVRAMMAAPSATDHQSYARAHFGINGRERELPGAIEAILNEK